MTVVSIQSKLCPAVAESLGVETPNPAHLGQFQFRTVIPETTLQQDRRRRPRLRVFTTGEVEYSFCLNGWLLFDDVGDAYRYLDKRPRG